MAFTSAEQARPFFQSGLLRPTIPVFEVLESSTWFRPLDRRAARASTGLHGDPCALWIGRLDANKDPLTVLDAVQAAASQLPDLHLWCCYTDAPLLPEVRARLAADADLARRVHLLGPVPHEQVQQLCSAADLFVSGSRTEGSGYAVIEAIACGATPLITSIPAFRRITREGAIGELYAPADADALHRALVSWSGRGRENLRRAARAHFERYLSFETVGRELVTAYRGVAERQ